MPKSDGGDTMRKGAVVRPRLRAESAAPRQMPLPQHMRDKAGMRARMQGSMLGKASPRLPREMPGLLHGKVSAREGGMRSRVPQHLQAVQGRLSHRVQAREMLQEMWGLEEL
jgi:hypothetical protein